MPSYARRVSTFGTSIFTEINLLAQQHNALNLGQGKPDFDTPPDIVAASVRALQDGAHNQYPPGNGIPTLRRAVAAHAGRFYDLDVDAERGVVVTSGASEGLFAAILGLTDPGDEVIVIEPFFDLYVPAITMAGAVPVYVPLHPPSWTFDPYELRAAFTTKTRLIILNTPNNPTGRVFHHDELKLIADLCIEHDVLVLSDEVYEHLLFDGARHVPIATLPGMFERTVTVSSAAKTFSATGWKCGWVFGHPDLVAGVMQAHQFITFAVHHPSQEAVAYALGLPDSYYDDFHALYAGKRGLMLAALDAAGMGYFAPEGAFFVMADYSGLHDGVPAEFARYLIEHTGVACIPPESCYCPEHQAIGGRTVRFAFCKNDATLKAAAERLGRLKL